MIKVNAPLSSLETSIISGIDDVQANHIKFHNISFCCDSIEDCEGRVFIQRKKGEWINIRISVNGDSSADCNRCGAIIHSNLSEHINFCPNCGANMREGGEK